MKTVTVHRRNLPPWRFGRDHQFDGLIYRGRKYVYKLFFDDPAYSNWPIWIAMLMDDESVWVECGRDIKADYIEFYGSKVLFYR